MTIIMITL